MSVLNWNTYVDIESKHGFSATVLEVTIFLFTSTLDFDALAIVPGPASVDLDRRALARSPLKVV